MDLPAIAGGRPAKTTPYGKEKRYGEEELRELSEALDQGTLFYASGKKVHQFEEEFVRKCGVRFGIASSSGTTAIHAAMIALGISPGEEVITGPITDMGSLIPILYQGAVPVFADLEPHTYVLSPQSVEANITERSKAILAIHLAGNACNMQALRDIAKRHGLYLIEDCAQALGCRYQGRAVGTFGHAGCYSMNEFKHISCGDGGIVITDDEEMARKLRMATDKAYDRTPGGPQRRGGEHGAAFLAVAARMTELQGAVALAQTRKLDSIVARRRRWCMALSERLSGLPGIHPPQVTEGCEHSWWFYMLRVDPKELRVDADTFAEALRKEGVGASAHYIGVCVYAYPLFTQHRAYARGDHPFCRYEYGHGLCPEAEAIIDTCVLLPVNQAYTDTDMEETAYAIRRLAEWFRAL